MVTNKDLKQLQKLLYIAIALSVLALIASYVKNVVTEKWLSDKKQVACIPAKVENSHPFVYRQTSLNPVQSDALVKSFVMEYVSLVYNEQFIDYHRLTNDNRYDNARLSASKYKAIEMSTGTEKALNMEKYARSNDMFYELQKGNLGWVFLVDDLLIYPGQNNGATVAVIRGSYQVTYDKVKKDLPSKLWGYREIVLLIQQAMPSETESSDAVNTHGLYVAASWENIVNAERKKQIDEKNYDFYMLKEN